jgi:hypothetical protein
MFCSRPEFEVLYGGAAGGGKSDCLIAEATRYVNVPGYKAIIFRRTFPQLQEIIDRCWNLYPKIGGVYKASEHRWYWDTGAFVQLSHMQHETNKYDHQGKEYHSAFFDEATQFLESQYIYIHSRVRNPPPGVQLRIRSTTNPGGVSHVFFKKRFIDIADPCTPYIDPVTGQSRCFVPATVYDNPTIMESDPLYIRRLEALPEIERRRLLYGEWSIFEGQAIPELSDAFHGCDPFEIPPSWRKVMVFDWGSSKPFACLYCAIDHDGFPYVYRAFYGMKDGDPEQGLRMTNVEICRKIIEIENGERIHLRVADPACWGPTKIKGNQILGPSFASDASKEGLFFVKADNDRIRGRQQVHLRLSADVETDKEGAEIAKHPRVAIFRRDGLGGVGVVRLWEELQSLREDEKNPEDVDTRQADHLYDCFRYFCMSRPITPKVPKKGPPPGSFAYERARYIRAKRYAQQQGISIGAAYSKIR